MEQKKRQIQSFIRKQNIPNILIYGPYLNGKDELCNFFIQLLYPNSEDYQKYVLCLNCLNHFYQQLYLHIELHILLNKSKRYQILEHMDLDLFIL